MALSQAWPPGRFDLLEIIGTEAAAEGFAASPSALSLPLATR
jgi:hypothetical protein